MRKLLLAVMLVSAPGESRAARLAAADFLNTPVDVRSMGMGETGQAAASGAGGVPVNPAALHGIEAHQFYFTHAFLTTGINMEYLSYGGSWGAHHWGAALQHVGYGELNGRDNAGNNTANFGPSDDAYSLAYGTDLGPIEAAAAFRFVRSEIIAKAQAVTFDAGGQLPVGEDWRVGLSGRNLGGELEFEQEAAPLPTTVAAGAGWKAAPGWLLALDVVHPLYSPSYVALGSEYSMPLGNKLSELAFRLGLNTKTPDLGAFSGLKAGFGLKLNSLDFDYAFSAAGGMGHLHHLAVGFRFGEPAENERFDR